MKLLPLLLLPLSGYCQQDAVVVADERIAYVGIDQPIEISMPGYSCADLEVRTNNGKLASTEDACKYGLEAERVGTAIISIVAMEDDKVLETRTIRTERLPDPKITVAGKTGGKLRKDVLEVQMGIVSHSAIAPDNWRFVVSGYTAAIQRDNKVVFEQTIFTPYFKEQLKEALTKMQHGDVVTFSDIKCIGPDKRTRTMQNMEFSIVE